MDEMDEYRERIERRYGPDRRAPKIEPEEPFVDVGGFVLFGITVGVALALLLRF